MTTLSKSGSFRAQTFYKLVQMIWNDPMECFLIEKGDTLASLNGLQSNALTVIMSCLYHYNPCQNDMLFTPTPGPCENKMIICLVKKMQN